MSLSRRRQQKASMFLQFDSVIHVNNGPSNPFSGFKGLKILIYLHLITSYVSYFH